MDSINGFGTTGFGYGQYGYMSPSYQLERQHYMERMEAVQRQAARAHKGDHSVLMGEYHDSEHGAVKSAFLIGGNLMTGAAKGALNMVKGMFYDSHGDFSLAQTALTVLSFTAVGAAFRVLKAAPAALALAKTALGTIGAIATVPTALKDAGRVATHYVNGNYEAAEEAANDLGQDIPGTAMSLLAVRSGVNGFKAATNETSLVKAYDSWLKEGEGGSMFSKDLATVKKPFIDAVDKYKANKPATTPAPAATPQPEVVKATTANPEATTADAVKDAAGQLKDKAVDASKQALEYASQQAEKAGQTWAGVKGYTPKWNDSKHVFEGAQGKIGFVKAAGYTQIPTLLAPSDRSLDQVEHGGQGGFNPGMGAPFLPGSPGIQYAGTNGTGFNIPTVIDLSTGAAIGQQYQSEH